jgi:hypothetical protein
MHRINISLTRKVEQSKGRVMRTHEMRGCKMIWVVHFRRMHGTGSNHGENHFRKDEVRNVDRPNSQNVDIDLGRLMQRDTCHLI